MTKFPAGAWRLAVAGGLLCAAFGGLALSGGAEAADGKPSPKEIFTTEDLNNCALANAYTWSVSTGTETQRYLDGFLAFSQLGAESFEEFDARLKMVHNVLTRPELKALADLCQFTLEADAVMLKAMGGFTNPYAARMTGPALAEAQRRAQQPQYSEPPAQAYSAPQVDPKDAQCRRIMDDGVERATKDMMNARKLVEAWIRSGAYGTALGSSYVEGGCNTIDSTINKLNAEQCPSDYADALAGFRNDYFIELPSGRMECSY